jgi:hypothetical protein
MNHFASPSFWSAYDSLPASIQRLADRNYEILKDNPNHPFLHFKKIGRYWSVRVGIHYRALSVEVEDGRSALVLDWQPCGIRQAHQAIRPVQAWTVTPPDCTPSDRVPDR